MNTVALNGLICLCFFGAMLACARLGRRLELARARRDPSRALGTTGIVEPSILGLLALLLGFTFSWSASRLDYQRRLIAEEANDIGTAYLRLDLLGAEAQPALRDLFRQYLEARIRVRSQLPRSLAIQPEPEESARLQREIWARAQAAVAQRPEWTPPAILLLPAINAMIDVTTSRRVELYSHVPLLIIALFAFVAGISALLVGRATAATNQRGRSQAIAFSAAVAMTLFVVLDLEFPRAGVIRLEETEDALVQLRETMR